MKIVFAFISILTISALLNISCCNPEDSATGSQIQIANEAELMEKYGPKDMTEEQVDSIIKSIEWSTNRKPPIFRSRDAKKGGSVILGDLGYPATLRSYGENSNNATNRILCGFVYETLLRIDPVTLNYFSGLADKWAISEDKKTYYYHINEKAKWQDDIPVTAFDVVATWDLLVDDALRDPYHQDLWEKFERPIALSKNIVKVIPKSPGWHSFFKFSASEFYILPEHIIGRIKPTDYMEEYNDKMMVGSGPYIFDKASTNQYITFKLNTDWWGRDLSENTGMYNFDRFRIIFFSERTVMIENFKKGEIDILVVGVARQWAQEFIPQQMPEIKYNHIIRQRVYTLGPASFWGYNFNMRKEPFNDKRVRKAVAHLLNREEMMKKLFFNEYILIDSYFSNSPYENENNPKIRYNPQGAIKLLEEAGYSQKNLNGEGYIVKDGKVFELGLNIYLHDDTRVETLFQEELKKVGIKLNLKKVTWATQIKDLEKRDFNIANVGYTSQIFPEIEQIYHSKFADKENADNIWGLKNKRVDEICEQYGGEYELKKRIKLLKELDYILMNEYMAALCWYNNNLRILYWNKFGMPEFVLLDVGFDGEKIDSETRSVITYWWYDEEADRALKEAKEKNLPLPAKPAEIRYWEKYR